MEVYLTNHYINSLELQKTWSFNQSLKNKIHHAKWIQLSITWIWETKAKVQMERTSRRSINKKAKTQYVWGTHTFKHTNSQKAFKEGYTDLSVESFLPVAHWCPRVFLIILFCKSQSVQFNKFWLSYLKHTMELNSVKIVLQRHSHHKIVVWITSFLI